MIDLLSERMHSLEALETLLRLHSDARDWTAIEMGERLNVEPDVAATAMDELVHASLAAATGQGHARRWRYSPGESRLSAAVDGLAQAYDSSRLEVMHAMTENAFERIRTDALATFTDASKFRGRKDG